MELNKSKLAKRYASSFIDVVKQSEYKPLLAQLDSVRELLDSHPELIKFSTNPLIDLSDRAGIIKDVLKPLKLSSILNNFIDVLLENGRLDLVAGIRFFFSQMVHDRLNESTAVVYSVGDLDAAVRKQITGKLEKLLGRTISLECKTDSAIIGGIRIQVSNKVLDYSIQGELQRINDALKEEG